MPFIEFQVNQIANRLRQWFIQNLGSVPSWLDPHIDAIAAFILFEHKDNPNVNQALTAVLAIYAAIGKFINPTEALAKAKAALATLPTGATLKQETLAILTAFQSDPALFPNATFSPVENLILNGVVKLLSGQSLFTAKAGEDEDEVTAMLAAIAG